MKKLLFILAVVVFINGCHSSSEQPKQSSTTDTISAKVDSISVKDTTK